MSDLLYEEEAIGKAYDLQILRRLWPYVRPYWRQVLITLGLVAPMLLMELAPAWVIKLALDQATASPEAAAAAVESGGWLALLATAPGGMSPWLWFGALYGIVILASTGLLDPGATEQVSFTAPAPGTYQFVCTFPGHNFSMFGDFTVK